MRPGRAALVVVLVTGASVGCAALSGLDSLTVVDCGDDCGEAGPDQGAADGPIAVADGRSDGRVSPGDANGADTGPGPTGDDAATDATGDDATTGDDGPTTDAIGDDGATDAPSVDASDAAPLDANAPDAHDANAPDAADASAPDAADAACPGTGGPVAVRVGSYCVDSTEVTVAQYNQFLAAKNGDTSGQPAYCSWNTTYQPSKAPGANDLPITYVDWCDAYMFCKWAGKRLCGAIGGGSTPYGSYASATASQWFGACSAGGAFVYPYGNTYDSSACNGKDAHLNFLAAVGSFAGCVGGYAGIYDMSGNAYEWEDSCDGTTGGNDNCHDRGGAYYEFSSRLTCATDLPSARNGSWSDTSFRCCSP